MTILFRWLTSALAIIAVAYLLPGVHIANLVTALVVALVLGILNAVVKPILFFLTLPITILTLGLFSLVLNAVIVLLVSKLVPGFIVDGFLWALVFSILLSFINTILSHLFK